MKKIPTATAQQHRAIASKGKKTKFFDTDELEDARQKYMDYLGQHVPQKPFTGPVRLITKWCFPITGKHLNGEYKTTKPDTDNLIKLFKDCMTKLGYWKDDAQIVSEITEKFYATIPGIFVHICPLQESGDKA